MKILITSGATREPIDQVRFITNMSSGETGAFLCDYFTELGHEVTLLRGTGATRSKHAKETLEFTDFSSLDSLIETQLAKNLTDVVIHAAAVGDFSVQSVQVETETYRAVELTKLDSATPIQITLKPNFKIVDRIRQYASNSPLLVAFKLTNTESEDERRRAITKLLKSSNADFVVHNDLSEIEANKERKFYIHSRDGKFQTCLSRLELAQKLERVLYDSSTGRR